MKKIIIAILFLLPFIAKAQKVDFFKGDSTLKQIGFSAGAVTHNSYSPIFNIRRLPGRGDSVFARQGGAWVFQFKDSTTTPAGNYGNVQINRNALFDSPASDSLDFDGGLNIKGTISTTSLASGAITDSIIVATGGTGTFKKINVNVISPLDTTKIVTGPTGFYASAYSPRSTFMYEKADKVTINGTTVTPTATDSTRLWEIQSITESTYMPTCYLTTNIADTTVYPTYYVRIGDWVHVWGTVDIDATAATTISEMGMSLPTTTSVEQIYTLAGTASYEDNTSVQIKGDVANGRAKWRFTPQSASDNKYSFHFSYKHITP